MSSLVQADAVLSIPDQSDWTDYGKILEAGALGEWDYQLWGAFTATATEKDGTYFLYYQGASGYRTTGDETVMWRAIGLATSPDGVNFTKYSNNPIVTWFPNDEGEEGAVSGGVTLDENEEIVLYYGANTARSASLVNADGRLATSTDGLSFTDQGVVLDHKDISVWGFGDELFPIIAFHDAGRWFVYYLPNGSPQGRKLGVAWGDSRANLSNSSAARSGLRTIPAWGTGGHARIAPNRYALFLNDVTQPKTEVREVSLNAPNKLSAPVETYRFDEVRQATVLLDEETNTWFMYYRNYDQSWYGLKLAPAGAPDTTPPTAPSQVAVTPVSDTQVDLSWSPATDSETGIVLYRVFRDGTPIATVRGWRFSDTGLVEQTEYNYEVSAINYHGVEGPRSAVVTAKTLLDVTPPGVVSVNASGAADQITVVFDEPVEQTSAERPSNYDINPGISVSAASLRPDLRSVILTTSEHSHGTTYTVRLHGVRDRAQTPNPIVSGTALSYTYSSVPGLVGAWTFDEAAGQMAFDTANYGNHGALIYTDKPGPAWTSGAVGHALRFDGVDDQVTVSGSGSLENVTDGSHTFLAWVNPDDVPPNTTVNNASYSALVRKYTGLYYDHNREFRGQIRLADWSEVGISSGAFDPGAWHHLAMVVDDNEKQLHLYVDGQEASNSPVSYDGSLADHETTPYYVGASEPLTERYEYRFKGRIDEAWIYDRALEASEVEALFARIQSSQAYLPVILKLD